MRYRLGHPLTILAGLVLAVAMLAVMPAPTAAHARLAASNPVNGAALDEMPAHVTLTYTEPLAAGSARVTVSTTLPNDPLAIGPVVADGAGVAVTLVDGRPDPRTVTLAWRVVSATDGHETTGLLIFSVGTGIPPRIDAAGSDENPRWQSVALRAVGLLGLVLQAAAIAGAQSVGDRAARRMALAGMMLAALGFAGDTADRDLLGRQAGQLLLGAAAMAGLGAMAVWAGRGKVAVAPWLLAVAAVVAGGHAAGDEHRILATLVGATHAALGLAWAGVIVALALSAHRRNPTEALRKLGSAALVGVAALAVAGVALTVVRVDGVRSLSDLTYGRLVIAKQALLAAAVATAAVNRLVLLPRMTDPRWTAVGRPVLAVEALVLAGAVAVAGALSSTPPAEGPRAVPVATRAIPIALTTTAGDLAVRVDADILGVEDDELRIRIADAAGRPLIEIQRLIVESAVLRPGEAVPIPVTRVDAAPNPDVPGAFTLPAANLAVGGLWTLDIIVRVAGAKDRVGAVAIDTSSWAFAPPRLVDDAWRWPRIPPTVPVLLLIAAILLAVGFRGIRGSRTIEPLPAVVILTAIVAIAAGFTVQAVQQIDPAPAGAGATPPDGELDLLAGAEDYATYCLACHGVDGGGVDDTDPLHDHGSGTNLLDADNRGLPNGHLFGWIAGGVPGTTMPAYDVALTVEERWALVAYLRTLQRDRPPSSSGA